MQPLPQSIHALDQALFDCVKGTDILNAIAPINFQEEKQRFFDSRCQINPEFRYQPTQLDLFARKRALFNLPVDDVQDSDLQQLYIDIIESYVDKLDQLQSVGSEDLMYDSLRYFGEPSEKDRRNARFILHLPTSGDDEPDNCDANEILRQLEQFAVQHHFPFQAQLSDSLLANALVSGDVIKINRRALINQTELSALAHHELGVHLLTTLNAREQPLKALSLGSPVNTTSQEGLAILCEYLAGCLTLDRLKVLALRVLAVDSLIRDKSFKQTFMLLTEEYGISTDSAFTITSRVYRGGGYTKDYLYLKGFHELLNAYEQRKDFANLMCGKVSLEHLDLITRLIDKGYLVAPNRIAPAIENPVNLSEVQQFIAHAIK